MGWIENLRQKPIEQRVRIIWTIAGIIAGLMLVAWVLIGNFRYSSDQKDLSILTALWNGIKKIGK